MPQLVTHDHIVLLFSLKAVHHTAERLRKEQKATAYTRLKDYFHEKVIQKLTDWLDLQRLPASSVNAPPKAAQNGAEKPRLFTTAERLIAFGQQTELFRDERDEPFVRFHVNGHQETRHVRSKAFKQWLYRQFYTETGKPPNAQAVDDALNVLEAQARFDGIKQTLSVRVAYIAGEVWLDLCDEEWRAVRVTRDGWQVVSSPPTLFRRYAVAAAQVEPRQGCNLETLRRFLNVRDDHAWRLVVACLVAAFLAHIPHPVPILYGEKGSTKSTAARLLSRLVDPSCVEVRSIPRDKTEWIQAADHCWLVVLDNVSRLPEWLSDGICRAVTGEGDSKRALYTDNDDVIFAFRRVVVITGIEAAAQESDVLDRAILLPLERIADEQRRSETELLEEFEEARPAILGALLDTVSGVLRVLPAVCLRALPRMADFAKVGVAVERVLGWPDGSFMAAYNRNIGEQNEEAIAASLVGEVIRSFMADRETWQGTAKELHDTLIAQIGEQTVRQREWPKTASVLSGKLKRLASNLRAVGIEITCEPRTGRSRPITMTRPDHHDQKGSEFCVIAVTSVTDTLRRGQE